MATTTSTVTWLRDMTFDAEVNGHHFIIDSQPPGGTGRGPSPVTVLIASVAACTAMDVISTLRKQRQQVTDLVVRAEGFRVDDHPRRFERVVVTYEVTGVDLDPHAVERAVHLSDQKYCSVAATLREAAEIETVIEIHDASPPNDEDHA